LNLSIQTYQSSHKVVVSTEKSKSGNASVGMTFGANHMIRMHAAVGHLSNFEMVDDLIEDLFGNETASIESLDPIPTGTRLTLDYFEDYLSLSLIKLGLSTKATRDEVYTYINLNPWILDINASRNAEWKARQNAILRSQEMWNEH
jgi:hypothetical protein